MITEDKKEMIDRLLRESQLSTVAAAEFIRQIRGDQTSPSTVRRWISRGINSTHLEGYRGTRGEWWTSREAIGRFFAAVDAIQAGSDAQAEKRSPHTLTTRERRAAEAEAELEKVLRKPRRKG